MAVTTTATAPRKARRRAAAKPAADAREELRRKYIDAGWSWVLFHDEPEARGALAWSRPQIAPVYTDEEAALIKSIEEAATLRAFTTPKMRSLAGVVIDMKDGVAAPEEVYVRAVPEGVGILSANKG